jgi:hypothetical protein
MCGMVPSGSGLSMVCMQTGTTGSDTVTSPEAGTWTRIWPWLEGSQPALWSMDSCWSLHHFGLQRPTQRLSNITRTYPVRHTWHRLTVMH